MDKNIMIKSNSTIPGEGRVDKDYNDNIGPLANALRQHIDEYYNVNKETTQQDDRQNQSSY